MRTNLFLPFIGVLPMVMASIGYGDIHVVEHTAQKKSCSCKATAASTRLTPKDVVKLAGNGQIQPKSQVLPVCPAELDELCTQTGQYYQTWCKSGGLFYTCERTDPDTDNDGDGTFGELHFIMRRLITTYHCTSQNYTVCGWWEADPIGVGSGQQKCCSNTTSEPSCPAGSCDPGHA